MMPSVPQEGLARFLFAGPCRFVCSAAIPSDLPAPEAPEIAFAGRSNVGKSSLINALTGRHALARVSATPGRTRQLNFFDLAGRLVLVDLPGYGYSRAAKTEQRGWQRLMFEYLRGRVGLRRVLLLLDSRLLLKESDAATMAMLDRAAVAFQLVLTKCDTLVAAKLAEKLTEATMLARAHPAAHPEVLATSARTGAGLAETRAALAALA